MADEPKQVLSLDSRLADGEPRMTDGDRALFEAAKGGDVELVELTPDLLKEMSEALTKRMATEGDELRALLHGAPYRLKLAIVAWVFEAIVDHAEQGGTFRYLIYERLGFGMDAYVPLYQAGGMTISNEFELSDGLMTGRAAPRRPASRATPDELLADLLRELGPGRAESEG